MPHARAIIRGAANRGDDRYDGGVTLLIILVVLALLAIVLVAAVVAYPRNRRPPAPRPPTTSAVDDLAARRDRQRALEPVEAELLDRRIELDGRRNMFGGDTAVFDAIERLEGRFRSGDISEDEFEAEKMRLLSGG